MLRFLKRYCQKSSLTSIYLALILAIFAPVTLISADIPGCPYEDTVDITGSKMLPNGTYLFQNKYLIDKNLVGYYDYEPVFLNQTEKVESHLRGCLCQITSCIQFCCPPDKAKGYRSRSCHERKNSISEFPYLSLVHHNGTIGEYHSINNSFWQQTYLPCQDAMYEQNFTLYENGSLDVFNFDGEIQTFSKKEYCMYFITPEDDGEFQIVPLICLSTEETSNQTNDEATHIQTTTTAFMVSVPCLLATIVVYATIPELRNMHGKCLISYLSCLTITYALFIFSAKINRQFSDVVCSSIGFTTYFFTIGAFNWLAVISFDLWHNFKGTNSRVSRLTLEKRFRVYFVFVWCLSFVCMSLTILGQFGFQDPGLRPGIGEEFCWFDFRRWSPMLYFFGPMTIILVFNTTVFISTALKIHRVQSELSRFAKGNTENNRHFNGQKDAYSMYLRLFVVMGISWVFEIASYLCGSQSTIFYITDFFNASMGVVIFALFVLKRKVLLLIKKRFTRHRTESHKMHSRTPLSQRCASTTQMSGVSLTHDTDAY